jgi:hypothetical protein
MKYERKTNKINWIQHAASGQHVKPQILHTTFANFVGIVHLWFYSISNNRLVAWRHMPACVYACAKWLDWYILTQDTPGTFTCGKFWQTRENCYTTPTFSNLLLLHGGIAQSVPHTSDLLHVPIWVLNIPDSSIGSNQQKRLVAKQ